MKTKLVKMVSRDYSKLLDRIAYFLNQARTRAVREINKAQVLAYWEIGKEIVEFEQKGHVRGEYGERLIEKLSKDMTQKFGRGFSPTSIKMMRLFYQSFPIRQTLSDEFVATQKPQTLSAKSNEKQEFQILSEKSETLSRKSIICQTVSDESEKQQTL